MLKREVVNPKGMAPPFAPYSLGIKAGNLIFTHGVMPLDASGKVVGVGNVALQTERVIKNLQTLIEEAGGNLGDIVMVQVFLTDFRNYDLMNQVYAKYFADEPPARYTVACGLCKPELLVEMAAIAFIDEPSPGEAF